MRSYKKIMPVVLTFALVGSAVYSFQNRAERRQQYDSALSQARVYMEKEIEKDAMEQYQTALALEPSLSVYLEAGEIYLTHPDRRGAMSWYENMLLPNYPKEAETYLYGLRACAMWEDYGQMFSIYKEYQKRNLKAEPVEEFIKKYLYTYSLTGTYEEVSVFGLSSGVAAVKYNDHWGYVDSGGKRKVSYRFEAAGLFGDYAPVIDREGRAIYIDMAGDEKINENFILEKDPEFGSVTEFKNIYSNLILACNGTQWNYYSLDTFEKQFGGYVRALPVANGVGAVSQDGGNWALIAGDGTLLTDFVFDEILADEKDIAYRGEALIARRDGAYILIDSKGQQIGSGRYTSAKPFYETTYAAVEKDGKWIYVDTAGQEYDLGEFEDAASFSCGMAAVKKDGKWGFIDIAGEMLIESQFYQAGPFNDRGACFVMTRPDQWELLRLYRFQA